MVTRYDCDVVVVGAGPGGSMAARYAAEGGMKVILLEKKAEIGAPLRCAEGVAKKWLAEVGITPDPKWIRADMKGAIIRSPSGYTFQLDESKAGSEVGYVLERHLFDKHLAELAAKAGKTYPCYGISLAGWYLIRLEDGTEGYVTNTLTTLQRN